MDKIPPHSPRNFTTKFILYKSETTLEAAPSAYGEVVVVVLSGLKLDGVLIALPNKFGLGLD